MHSRVFVGTGMLGNVGRGTSVLAAERQPLCETQRDEQNRRQPADRVEGRQHADEERRGAHNHDSDEKGIFAADQVADAAEDQSPEGPDEKAGGVGRERRCASEVLHLKS